MRSGPPRTEDPVGPPEGPYGPAGGYPAGPPVPPPGAGHYGPPPPPPQTLRPPQVGAVAFLPPPPSLPAAPAAVLTGAARRSRLLIIAVVAVLLGAVSIGSFVLVGGRGPSAPAHPDVWDPRVTELVGFVERERGLSFKHPVFIDFLPAEDIARQLRAEVASPTGEQLQAAVTQASQLRALGLVTGDVDLLASGRELSASGVVAFYDPTTKRITAPEGDFGPAERATLVHELTHVLQDQHFDLDRTGSEAPDQATYRALAEGDAMRIEGKYVHQLSATDQAELRNTEIEGFEQYAAATSAIAPTLDAFQQAPYLLGEGMVNTVFDIEGQAGVDAAFRHPAVSDEALIDPSNYRGHGSVLPAQPPAPVAGEEVLDQGQLGPLTWFLMLSEIGDPSVALHAAYGWGGDAYVMVRTNDQTCMRIAYRGDTPDDVAEMRTGLDLWVAAAPAIRREVTIVGDQLVVTACDPGTSVPVPLRGTPTEALIAPRVVMEYALDLHAAEELPYAQARCVAIEFVAQYSVAELVTDVRAETATAEQQAVRDRKVAAARARCY